MSDVHSAEGEVRSNTTSGQLKVTPIFRTDFNQGGDLLHVVISEWERAAWHIAAGSPVIVMDVDETETFQFVGTVQTIWRGKGRSNRWVIEVDGNYVFPPVVGDPKEADDE